MEKKSIVLAICLPFFWIGEASAQRLERSGDFVVSKVYAVKDENTDLTKSHPDVKKKEQSDDIVAVVFSGFEVKEMASGSVLLSWNAYSESNNGLFFIERSADGIHWTELAQYSSSGGAKSVFCSFVDDEQNARKRYYRLRQIDVNGNLEYAQKTELSMVDSNRKCKQHSGRAKVCLSIQSDKEIDRMELSTESGKLIYSGLPKTKMVDINLENSIKEFCFVTMYSADAVIRRKLLVD